MVAAVAGGQEGHQARGLMRLIKERPATLLQHLDPDEKRQYVVLRHSLSWSRGREKQKEVESRELGAGHGHVEKVGKGM